MITPRIVSTEGVYTPANVPNFLAAELITKSTPLDANERKRFYIYTEQGICSVLLFFKSRSISKNMKDFFKELKVVELSSVLAGPAVGMFFAELGADVVKIENKTTDGDVTRKWKLNTESKSQNVSAYFSAINYGKRHLFLDLRLKDDLEILTQELIDADIVTTNFKFGDAEKFGLTFEFFKKINPLIIQCQLFGFRNDPSRPAFDAVLQGETGFMHINGQKNSPPTKMPVALIDVLAAHQMKEAILIALIKKEKQGIGSYIEVSLEESAIASLVNQATNWLMNQVDPERSGSIHPNIAPYGETFSCLNNEWVVFAVGNDKQFNALAKTLDLGDQLINEKYETNQKRVINREDLGKILAEAIANFDREKLVKLLLKQEVPVGSVNSIKDVFETETGKSMILSEEIEGVKTLRPSSVAFHFSD